MKFTTLLTSLLLFFFVSCKKEDPIKVTQMSYPLPGAQFFPEGIAYNANTGIFYTGSTTNGDILEVNVETGATDLFAAGAKQGRSFCTGMKVDNKARLWVCGGSTNIIQVLDKDGNLLKSWDTKALFNSGFINDCIIKDDYIYFTDSQVKKVYRAKLSEAIPATLEEWLSFTDAQIPYATTGTNANGIELTPDGKSLIVVISTSGKLFKINIASKAISEIVLSRPLVSGDGLLLHGSILYVSPNTTGQIFPVQLNADYSQGLVGAGFGKNLLFNTTMAMAGKYILVVNAQLNRRGGAVPPVLPFSVSRVSTP